MTSPSLDILGVSGLQQSHGTISDEWHIKLRGPSGVKYYREMLDNDPVIGGIMFMVECMIRQVPWHFEPADEDDKAKEAAWFVESCFDDMSHTFDDFLSDALSFLGYGWAMFERVYKERKGDADDPRSHSKHSDGKIGIRKLAIRSQSSLDHWEFDEDGGIRGMWQNLPTGGRVFLPIERCLLFRLRSHKNNPEGRSLFRNAVRSYHFAKHIDSIEATGVERDLAGLPVLEVPPGLMASGASAADAALRLELQKLVQQVRRDEREGLVLPSELDREGKPTGYRFRLVTSGGARRHDTSAIVQRHRRDIAMSVRAEMMMLGMDKVGSYSLADSKTSEFAMALAAIMGSIASVINRFLVPDLMKLNGYVDPELWPTLMHGDIEKPELDKIGNYINQLTVAGIPVTDLATQRKLRELGDLPPPDEDLTIVPPPENGDANR